MAVDLTEIQQSFDYVSGLGVQVALPAPGEPDSTQVPARWRAIADSGDAAERCELARSMWNASFLALVPRFAAALTNELADVRVGTLDGEWILVYALEHIDGEDRDVVSWIGWDPDSFGVEPECWSCIPQPLQTFLRDVHAGFTAPDLLSFGPRRPRHIRTVAAASGLPGGIDGWMSEPDSTRLWSIAQTYSRLICCVSPDLQPGQGALTYGRDVDAPQDLGGLLDQVITTRFLVLEQEYR